MESQRNQAAPSKKAILIVEDDLNLLYIEERFLMHAGYAVMCAQDVDRALQLARKEMPGILLLDINLPSGNGINVHARLRSDPALRDIPVIYVTGERTEHTMAKAHKMGAYSVLYKPFNLDDLLMNVKSALRSFMTRQKGMRQLQSPGNAVSTHSQDSLEFKREERIWLQC